MRNYSLEEERKHSLSGNFNALLLFIIKRCIHFMYIPWIIDLYPLEEIFIWSYCNYFYRSDDSDEEFDDGDIQKIIIITQSSHVNKKHPGGDRTGIFTSRTKLTEEYAEIINEGLYYYEQVSNTTFILDYIL